MGIQGQPQPISGETLKGRSLNFWMQEVPSAILDTGAQHTLSQAAHTPLQPQLLPLQEILSPPSITALTALRPALLLLGGNSRGSLFLVVEHTP